MNSPTSRRSPGSTMLVDLTRRARAEVMRAARVYGKALKDQHRASAAMHRARMKPTAKAREQEHDAACASLDRAQHELLVAAAVLSGFSRRSAERSV